MALNTQTAQSSGQGNHVKNGIFVEEVTISSVKEFSGRPYMDGWAADELSLEIVWDIGKDFQPSIYVGGGLGWGQDEQGNEVATGFWPESGRAAVSVAEAVRVALGRDVEVDDSARQWNKAGDLKAQRRIADADLKDMIGKKILVVTYKSTDLKDDGKPRYRSWNRIFAVGRDLMAGQIVEIKEDLKAAQERAADAFLDDYERSGWPKNYDAKGGRSKGSGDGAAGNVPDEFASSRSAMIPDDEIPF